MLKGARQHPSWSARNTATLAKQLDSTMSRLSDSMKSLEKLAAVARSDDPRKYVLGRDYERAMQDVRTHARGARTALRAGTIVVDDVISWAK